MALAQQIAPPPPRNVSDALESMQSNDLRKREASFEELMTRLASEGGPTEFFSRHPDKVEQVKVGLIQLLMKENGTFIASDKKAPLRNLTEEDGEYYAEVIDVVSSLNDERSIPALVGAMTTGGMAQRGLLKYGDKALEPALEQLKNPDALVRAVALGMSVTLLEKRNDPTSRKRAVDIIRSSLTDSAAVVRGHAVREIGCLDERQEFLPILEKIAKTDPERLPGKALDGGDGDEFYPVRYDARAVLRDIKNNKACQP